MQIKFQRLFVCVLCASNIFDNFSFPSVALAGDRSITNFHPSNKSSEAQTTFNPRTYVHLFEWKWTDIASECENFLGAKGYAAVQVSPPQEHRLVKNFPWYQRYQPVSYKLESRSGNRAEFADLVKRCKAAGVDIYVDAVINHTTGVLEPGQTETASAGSRFGRYEYPDYHLQDFHHCDRNGNDDLKNWRDRYEVQNCELLNLADLNTSSEKVRSRLVAYLNDTIDLGVAGFRIDAAKHISANDLAAIFSKLHAKPFIYQEIIATQGEPIQPPEYFANGSVSLCSICPAIISLPASA